MNKRSIHIENGDPFEELKDILDGKVFHVSLTSYWSRINKSGEIRPNNDNALETTFGSAGNSYFNNKGCVSLFDYRNMHSEEAQNHIHKYQPTLPLRSGSGITIFILKPETYACLMTWEDWKNENDLSQMVVPHVEAGYPGAISLDSIEEVIHVTWMEDQNSLTSRIRKAEKQAIERARQKYAGTAQLPIKSANCLIRKFKESDVTLLADIEFDPEVKKYVGLPERSKDEWLSQMRLDLLSGWAVEALPEQTLAGRVSIDRAHGYPKGTAELQIILGKTFWGRKLGREVAGIVLPIAFSNLNAVSVIADVHPDNQASLDLLEYFGFFYLEKADEGPNVIYELTSDKLNA